MMNDYNKDRTIAIVLAAGSGSRMITRNVCRHPGLSCGTAGGREDCLKKQFMDLMGRPLLTYSLDSFEKSRVDEICLVVSPEDEEYVRREVVEKYGYRKVVCIVPGGAERYLSVYRGLLAVHERWGNSGDTQEPGDVKGSEGEHYVLIHDAARALITPELVNRCIRQVRKDKSCVMGVPAKDTIRLVDDESWSKGTPPRKNMWIVHTPQCFVFEEILEAFHRMMEAGDTSVTDDGMVMERYGVRSVRMFEGSYENIKITTLDDILIGEAILKKRLEDIEGAEDENKGENGSIS